MDEVTECLRLSVAFDTCLEPFYTEVNPIMSRARHRIPRLLLPNAVPPGSSALSAFYREEFIKHHKCLQAQREYYSDQAINSAETALLKIISEMDRLSETANAEQLVAKLLREFDFVTGLSGWSAPDRVH